MPGPEQFNRWMTHLRICGRKMERISSHPDPFVDIIHPRSQAAREAKTMIKLFAITLALGSMVGMAVAQQSPTPPTAELAKKCRELEIKAYPPKPAGSTKIGIAQEERDYFARCIRNGGNMDNGDVKKGDDAK